MNFKFTFLLVSLLTIFTNAQNIKFISEKDQLPLTKVSVFSQSGNLIGFSDIDGNIPKDIIKKEDEDFKLVHDNMVIATLSYSELQKDIIRLKDRVKDIEAVVVNSNKTAKYILLRGYFNTYLTVNDKLNCYADGIITFVFDNKTQKYKSSNVEEYRVYRLDNPKEEKKQTNTWDFNQTLDLPDVRKLGNIEEYYANKNGVKVKELKKQNSTEIEVSGENLQNKEMALLGYRFFDFRSILNISFEKDSPKKIKNFLEYNELNYLKIKHKSEQDYNQLINYTNFYPTEISFSDENNIKKVPFSKRSSHYKNEFWKAEGFPNMQEVFGDFFKEQLKETENKK